MMADFVLMHYKVQAQFTF